VFTVVGVAAVLCGTLAARGDDDSKGKRKASPTKSAAAGRAGQVPWAEREKAALAFVHEHHPELGVLLEQLKPMRPTEYNRAIAELAQVSRSLGDLKERNPRRYEMALAAWKARSKAEVLAARLLSSPSEELESQLRSALEEQFEAELRMQEMDREQFAARLKKVEESIKRLKKDRNKMIDSRLEVLKNKAQRGRRFDAGKSTRPTRPKGESKA
jgi:hypothetical protein